MAKANKQRLKVKDYIPFLCLLACFVWACFPLVSTYVPTVVVIPLSVIIWFLYVTYLEHARFGTQGMKTIYPIVFVVYCVIISYLFGIPTTGNRYIDLLLIYLAPIIYNYYKKADKMYILIKVVKITSLCVLYTTIKTMKELIQNPYAARAIKRSGTEEILKGGIGGYSLIYFLVVAAIVLAYVAMKDKRTKVRIVCIGAFLLAEATIILSNYFTALICSVICVALMIILNYSTRGKKRSMALFMFAIFAVMLLIFGNQLISMLIKLIMNIAPSGKTASRLNAMQGSLLGGIGDEMEGDRLPTIIKSFEAVLKHPFMGLVSTGSYSEVFSFGQHSHIMDTFALFGIVAGVVNVFALTEPFKTDGVFVKTGAAISIPLAIAVIIIYGLNNATPSTAIAIGVLYPMARDYYN